MHLNYRVAAGWHPGLQPIFPVHNPKQFKQNDSILIDFMFFYARIAQQTAMPTLWPERRSHTTNCGSP